MLSRPKPTPPLPAFAPGQPLAWLGLLLLLVPWLVRATTNATTLPAWDFDPLAFPVLSTSLTPAASLLCDGVSILGGALLLVWAGRRGIPLNLPILLLALIGGIAVVLHGWVLGPSHGTLGNQRIGAAWLSAVFGAVSLWHAGQALMVRRIAAGAMLGLIVVLAIYGAVQVFYTHAQTVADFNADPDRFLSAHGWPRDSPMAKAFMRRLMQPEAIGWFGLANVYATFAAGATAFGAVLVASKFRSRAADWVIVVGFTLASALALALAKSKGGYVAAGAGFASAIGLYLLSRRSVWPEVLRRRVAGMVGLAAIAGPIALIVLRGQIGERIGELSLFFRWFYIQAAVRIFGEHPVIGVGPDGFQRVFTIAKPPLCPEEVSSPHGVVFDWTATLGVLGLAWVWMLGRMAWHAATAGAITPLTSGDAYAPLSRAHIRTLLAIPIGVTLLGLWVESGLSIPGYSPTEPIMPDAALSRVGGVVLWCIAAWAIARMLDRSIGSRIALAAAAIVLIAHGQIDVAGSLVSSVGLWFGIIALAAAPDSRESTGARTIPSKTHTIAGGTIVAAAVLVLFTSIWCVRPWERDLAEAAETVHPLADLSERLASLKASAAGVVGGDSPQAILRDLEGALGHAVPPSPEGIRAGMFELERRLLPPASERLVSAFDLEPSDRRPLREASRLHLRLAEQAAETRNEQELRRRLQMAADTLRMDSSSSPPSSSDWHWLASVHEHAADLTRDTSHIPTAIAARQQITALDPYNLENAKRLVQDFQRIGDHAQAKAWAARCLELNTFMRLDRETRALSDEELKNLTELATAP